MRTIPGMSCAVSIIYCQFLSVMTSEWKIQSQSHAQPFIHIMDTASFCGTTHLNFIRSAQIQDLVKTVFQSRPQFVRSEEHTSELQSRGHLVCRLLLEKKKTTDDVRKN